MAESEVEVTQETPVLSDSLRKAAAERFSVGKPDPEVDKPDLEVDKPDLEVDSEDTKEEVVEEKTEETEKDLSGSKEPKEGDEQTDKEGVKKRFDGEDWVVIDKEDSEQMFKIGDGEYSQSQVEEFKKAHDDKTKWNAENTNKSKATAEDRGKLDGVVELVKKLQSNDEGVNVIRDAIEEEFGEGVLKSIADFDIKAEYAHPDTEKVINLENTVKERDQEIEYLHESFELMKNANISPKKVGKVVEYVVKKGEETNGRVQLDLATGYALMQKEKLEKELNDSKKTLTQKPDKTSSAKEIKSEQKFTGKSDLRGTIRNFIRGRET